MLPGTVSALGKQGRAGAPETTATWEVEGRLPAAYLSDSDDDGTEEARLL